MGIKQNFIPIYKVKSCLDAFMKTLICFTNKRGINNRNSQHLMS